MGPGPRPENVIEMLNDFATTKDAAITRLLPLNEIRRRKGNKLNIDYLQRLNLLRPRLVQQESYIPTFLFLQRKMRELSKETQALQEREFLRLVLQRTIEPSFSRLIFFEWQVARDSA